MKYYPELTPPNYEQANVYASELEEAAAKDFGVLFDLAEFYLRWSIYLRKGYNVDFFAMNLRIQKYKELAKAALRLLEHAGGINTHEKYYMLAQAHFNLWDNDAALREIGTAISRLPKGAAEFGLYSSLQGEIRKKKTALERDTEEERGY